MNMINDIREKQNQLIVIRSFAILTAIGFFPLNPVVFVIGYTLSSVA